MLAGFGRRGDGGGIPVGGRAPAPTTVDDDTGREQDQGGNELPAAGNDDHRAGRIDRGVDQPRGQRAATGVDEQTFRSDSAGTAPRRGARPR